MKNTKQMEMIRNEEGALPCRHCFKKGNKTVYPRVIVVDDLYYAQCPECNHYDKYEFLGATRKATIKNWNDTMEGRNIVHSSW